MRGVVELIVMHNPLFGAHSMGPDADDTVDDPSTLTVDFGYGKNQMLSKVVIRNAYC